MKQKLLNSIRLRVWMLVAILCAAFAGQAWADTKTEGFEGKTAGNDYQSTVTVSTSESDCGIGWELYYGTVSESSKISGSNSAALRLYSSSSNLGYLKTTTPIEGLSNVSFKAKASTSNSAKIKVNVDYSIDGSSWTTIASNQLFSSSASTYNFNIPSGGKYFRLIITSSSTKPTKSSAQLTIDDVVFTYTPAAALSSIALSGTYPTTFHQGDTFSHDGMIVTATYADDSQADVTASATFSGYDMSSTGVQTVTVSYTENEVTKTATYNITVIAPATLTSIALSGTYPTEFDYGAAFSSEGIVVTANYDDDTNKIVTGDATFSGYNMTSAGAQTVTVSYTEKEVTKTTTYGITVNAYVQPTSVTVNMNYAWLGSSNGSNISADKLPVVKAQDNVQITITDGTSTHPRGDANYIRVYVGSTMTFEAPSGYDITGIVFTTGGSGTWNAPNVNSGTLSSQTWSGTASSVTFTMTGSCFISSAAITLAKQKSLSSIAVSGTYPTVFEVGDEFSHEGAVVTATYDDDSNADVTASATFSGYNMSVAGEQTVTVSYTENAVERTSTYDINVKTPAALESIALSGSYPTTFHVGDEFSHEGMTVTATFDDESNADVTASATFSGYDMSASGEQTVTVSYTHKGATTKTTTYVITVNTVPVTGVSLKASTEIERGDTETLTPTFTPSTASNKNVTWESDNTDVATVSVAGVVTAVAAGTATITVTTEDGGYTANCEVTVTLPKGTEDNPYTVAEVIAMEPTSTSIPASGQSDIYVMGYIVGGFNSKSAFTTTSSEFQESNLAIADDYNETTAANVIPVQLAKDSDPRDNYNVVDHKHFVNVVKVIVKADVLTYFSVPGLKNVDEMNKVAEIVKVTSAGFATWASDSPLDFTDKDIDAYIAITKGDGTGVTFTQINKVPANTGVLLHYEGGKNEEIPVFDGTGAESTAGNKFVKGAGENVATDDGDNYNYILNQPSEKPIGFYRANAQKVAKNRAYISIAKSESGAGVKEFLSIDFDDATAIAKIQDSGSKIQDSEIFNLAGQKMSKLQKGVNIVNGKKVLVK